MPKMNGVQTALIIKDIDQLKTPIFAITSSVHLIGKQDTVFDENYDKKNMLTFISNLIKDYH